MLEYSQTSLTDYPFIFQSFLYCTLLYACFTDLKWRRVPNYLTFSSLLSALFIHTFYFGWGTIYQGLFGSLLGASLCLILMLIPFYFQIYRGGDVKLLIACGAWLGPLDLIWSIAFGVTLGGLLGLLFLIFATPQRRSLFIQRLWTGAVLKTLPLAQQDQAQEKVPMALAFSLGVVIALHRDFLYL